MMGFRNWLQHKPLLLFYLKKVIVAKVKLCGKLLHKKASVFCDCGHYTMVGGIMQVEFVHIHCCRGGYYPPVHFVSKMRLRMVHVKIVSIFTGRMISAPAREIIPGLLDHNYAIIPQKGRYHYGLFI